MTTLPPVPGHRIVHQHREGDSCTRGLLGCFYERTLLGRIADWWNGAALDAAAVYPDDATVHVVDLEHLDDGAPRRLYRVCRPVRDTDHDDADHQARVEQGCLVLLAATVGRDGKQLPRLVTAGWQPGDDGWTYSAEVIV